MEKHLKLYQYYSDLYDQHTVDHCRRILNSFVSDDSDLPENEKVTKQEALAIKKWAREMMLHFHSGERYLNKESSIRSWMDSDKKKDDLYESAQPPEDIRCLTCRNRLKATFKTLWYENGNTDRVLFMFDCPNKCLPRRAFFNDGEEWRTKPDLCPKCDIQLDHTEVNDEVKIVITCSCKKCGYTKTKIDEYLLPKKDEEEIDENFATDRDRFCMTNEEGKKFQEEKWNLESVGKFMEEWKEEQKKREEKLKDNPKGFHLEGSGYTCAICSNNTSEGDNWFDEYGIKCLVCQKAIDEGEIPPYLAKDKESWYSKYDLESDFNIKSPTLRKWVKQGIIKPRTVSIYGKGEHIQLFLIEDNKDFLPPKELVKSQSVREKKEDGKVWTHMEPWYRFVDPYTHLKGYKIMNHLRVVSPEEAKAMEEEKARKKRFKK